MREDKLEYVLDKHVAAVTMQFDHIFSRVAARLAHDREEDLIENCAPAGIANETVM